MNKRGPSYLIAQIRPLAWIVLLWPTSMRKKTTNVLKMGALIDDIQSVRYQNAFLKLFQVVYTGMIKTQFLGNIMIQTNFHVLDVITATEDETNCL